MHLRHNVVKFPRAVCFTNSYHMITYWHINSPKTEYNDYITPFVFISTLLVYGKKIQYRMFPLTYTTLFSFFFVHNVVRKARNPSIHSPHKQIWLWIKFWASSRICIPLYKTHCSNRSCDEYKSLTQILSSLWIENFETFPCFFLFFLLLLLTTRLCYATGNSKYRQQHSETQLPTLLHWHNKTTI